MILNVNNPVLITAALALSCCVEIIILGLLISIPRYYLWASALMAGIVTLGCAFLRVYLSEGILSVSFYFAINYFLVAVFIALSCELIVSVLSRYVSYKKSLIVKIFTTVISAFFLNAVLNRWDSLQGFFISLVGVNIIYFGVHSLNSLIHLIVARIKAR